MMLNLVTAVSDGYSNKLKMLIAACAGQVFVDSLTEASQVIAQEAEQQHLELRHSQYTARSAPYDTI